MAAAPAAAKVEMAVVEIMAAEIMAVAAVIKVEEMAAGVTTVVVLLR